MRTALIIGGTRNLGPGIAAALLDAGFFVSVFHRGVTVADALPANVERLRGDRSDAASLAAAVGSRSFEVVVDTTLYNGPDGESAGRIFTGRTGRYIMLSTGQVYLVRAGLDRPFAERDYAGPVVPAPANSKFDLDNWSYGVHKRAAEDALTAAPVPVTILRLREFQPDLIHITGPGDVSILGLWAASLVGAPAMAAWHTNIHEYAYRRLQAALSFLPRPIRERVSTGAGNGTLRAAMRFYRIAHFVAAANQEMVDLLGRETGRPSFLMAHGVDTGLFVPARRRRTDSHFQIGYVGRLTPEKNVRALVELERNLLAAGERDFRIVLVGEGGERDWLGANLRHARFAGVLHGEELANTFANLDALVFPSLTDTFGLVMLEAMSSGVPVIVNPETGSRAGVIDGVSGFLTHDFAGAVRQLMSCREARGRMSAAARLHARSQTWPRVFEDLYRIYGDGLRAGRKSTNH